MATSKSSNDDLLKSIFEMVESKSEQKQQRKKRVMSSEQKAIAIKNLAAGRAKSLETRRRKKAEKEGGIVPSRPAPEPPKPEPPKPAPVELPKPAPVELPKPAPVELPKPVEPIPAPVVDNTPYRITTWGMQSLW
jgi:cell division protein FtsN